MHVLWLHGELERPCMRVSRASRAVYSHSHFPSAFSMRPKATSAFIHLPPSFIVWKLAEFRAVWLQGWGSRSREEVLVLPLH